MSRQVPIDKYPSVTAAAADLGVSRASVLNHHNRFGNLDLLRDPQRADNLAIQMPDGTVVPSIEAAAAQLGLSPTAIRYHLNKHGHLKFAGLGRRVRTETTAKGPRGVSLAVAPWENLPDNDPRHETEPRHRRLVGERVQRRITEDDVVEAITRIRSALQ